MISRDAAQYLRQLTDTSLTSEDADLDEWQRLQDALSSVHILSGLQLGPLTRVAITLLDRFADFSPSALGWCHYIAVRMAVSSVELRHAGVPPCSSQSSTHRNSEAEGSGGTRKQRRPQVLLAGEGVQPFGQADVAGARKTRAAVST